MKLYLFLLGAASGVMLALIIPLAVGFYFLAAEHTRARRERDKWRKR